MTGTTDKPADATRYEVLRAASHQFAMRAYHQVGLDDILAEAELTKGALYFHFHSKHALALAVINEQVGNYIAAIEDLVARRLSGLETLIDSFYLIAVEDLTEDAARASLHLLESVGRFEGLQVRLFGRWMDWLASIAARAATDGDIIEQCDPQDIARMFVALYAGLRQTGNLDDPEQFLLDLERIWIVVLTGIIRPDRTEYFHQFIRRRTALAINKTSAPRDPS